MSFAIGKKVGMTRVFDSEGKAVAVSIVSVIPSKVSQVKNLDKNLKKVKLELMQGGKTKKEIEFSARKEEEYKVGQDINAKSIEGKKFVNISGSSKGKGFAGVIKRHGFSRGPETHGSNHHRSPGAIGGAYPQRVVKGKKMPGRLGGNNSTVKNLKIVEVDSSEGYILIAGAIPGPKKSIVKITAN